MDTVLRDILINTYNSNFQLRTEAEQSLNFFLQTSGALYSLLTFISLQNDESVDRELRLAAAICVKNKSRDYYRKDEAKISISDDEKETCKELILNVILSETDNVIRGMLAESIRNISEFEYPQR
jgi:beta-lactamase class A